MKRLHNASLHNHVYSQGKMFKLFCIQKYRFFTSAIICNKERKYLQKTGYQLQMVEKFSRVEEEKSAHASFLLPFAPPDTNMKHY